MATLIELRTVSDNRGKLTIVEQNIPFAIKRIYYVYSMDSSLRGGHRHKRTRQALICLKGKCGLTNDDGSGPKEFLLDSPEKCVILEPTDWHQIEAFSSDAILMVLASELFDPEDYLYTPYP